MNGLTRFERGEIQRAARWLRSGLAIGVGAASENPVRWLYKNQSGIYEACAIGFVLIGKIRDVAGAYVAYEERLAGRISFDSHRQTMIYLTGMQPTLLDRIHELHYSDRLYAMTILDCLEDSSH